MDVAVERDIRVKVFFNRMSVKTADLSWAAFAMEKMLSKRLFGSLAKEGCERSGVGGVKLREWGKMAQKMVRCLDSYTSEEMWL